MSRQPANKRPRPSGCLNISTMLKKQGKIKVVIINNNLEVVII